MKLIRSLAVGALVPVSLVLMLQVHIEPDQNNVTAGRLSGVWQSDPVVSTRMGLKGSQETIEFYAEDNFLTSVPDSVTKELNKHRIFETGMMVTRQDGKLISSAPYLLTSVSGNPHLLKLRAENGVPLAGIESANIFVAPGRERHQDLLLLGGDVNNEAFRSFRRTRP